ncbi:unnamed protein product [Owenia fusiformis]|nr:unnamed protein product [Owenia fusiformis]
MVVLALEIRKYCTQGIPLLKANKNRSITMTQHQAACLLANAFFCTFPRRNTRKRDSEFANYPDINFSSLFSRGSRYNTRKAEKLHCIFHYFKRVTDEMPQGTITFRRQVIDHNKCPNWASSDKPLTRLHVTSKGTIEDDGKGMLQVDFANKFLGGGVLGHGCVQEEIRFLICPELILSKLVTEKLEAHECLIMTGCMRFSNYTGYADSFRWNGDHFEVPERDAWGRVNTEVVAIDALVFHQYNDQFKTGLVKRELNKAYAGFYAGPDIPEDNNPAVATGNWGCGAFGGDLRLKALIQIMAAAEANRDVCYFTFGDNKLRDDMFEIHKYFKDRDLKVGDVYSYILQYNRNYCQKYAKPKKNLFQYILKAEQSGSETEEENEAETPIITLDDSDDESKVWEKLPADLESIEKLGPDKSSSGNVGSYRGQSGSNAGHNLDEHEAMEVDGVDANQTSSKDSYSKKRNTEGHVKHKVDSDGSSSP